MCANPPQRLPSSKLLFRAFGLQSATWLICLPYLSMDALGIELATSITNEYRTLLDYLQSSNYILPWPTAYGLLHTTVIQMFIHSLVQPGRNGQRPWQLLHGIVTTIRVLQTLTFRFPGLAKQVYLVKSMERAFSAVPVVGSIIPIFDVHNTHSSFYRIIHRRKYTSILRLDHIRCIY
jgi:hypothetical protein